ncbi:MAG: extracellular solute-binding protein [Candidatus Eisenbacteria bacterium]|uniref:Extracellular solute-binding protein n=1 Tax=Eiseniibacteriota bacterium TaxID=2212470 RepID=A0A538T1L2_UNCEI|nr:MAG: extracellular solute-binding protein [Candidatus Eisenbacteria bacterium]
MGSRGHPVVALWVALAVVVALTGCGRRDRGTTTVVFWQFSPLPAIQPVLDKFQHEHPGIRVEVEQLTWQSGREKIVAAVAAGRPPDLCEIGSTFLPGLVADSTLIDLTDSIADLKPELRGWRVTEYLGRSYAIPWMLGTRAMYMNADLMRGVGLPPENPPTTWTDFARAVEQIDAAGPDLKGFGMNAGEREVLFKKFMPFAWGNGGDILDSTLTHSVVYSPQNVEALRFYLSLKPFSLLDRQEMLDEAFTRGRIGFTISGPWMLRKLPESAPQLHFVVILMPRPGKDRGTPASFAGAEALGIFRGAKEKSAALTLARFLVREENAMPLYIATGNAFPAAAAAVEDTYFVSHPRDKVFVQQLQTAVAPPVHPRWVEIEEILNSELEEAIYGKKPADEALRSADQRIGALLQTGR